MRWLAGLLGLLLWTAAPASDQQEIEQATARFLTSFENLDMPAFIACFALVASNSRFRNVLPSVNCQASA